MGGSFERKEGGIHVQGEGQGRTNLVSNATMQLDFVRKERSSDREK